MLTLIKCPRCGNFMTDKSTYKKYFLENEPYSIRKEIVVCRFCGMKKIEGEWIRPKKYKHRIIKWLGF